MRQRILIPYSASALSANTEATVQGTPADARVEWHNLGEFPRGTFDLATVMFLTRDLGEAASAA